MQNSENKKFVFVLGVLASGVLTVSFVLTLCISALQLFVFSPVETFFGLHDPNWQLSNVGSFRLEKAQDFQKAETELIRQASEQPDSPIPYYLLGELYQTLNMPEEALKQYQSSLGIAEKNWYNKALYYYIVNNTYANEALIYYEQNNKEAALRAIGNIRDMKLIPPGGNTYWALKGYKNYSLLENKLNTVHALKDVLEHPKRADFHLTLGRQFCNLMKLELAHREAETALQLSTDPTIKLKAQTFLNEKLPIRTRRVSPLLRYYTLAADANEYMKIDLKSAADFYERAIAENPDFEWSYHHLGLIHRELNNYTRALGYAQKATEINPRFYMGYLTMGDIELDRENYGAAIEHFSKARDIIANIPRPGLEDVNIPANIENQLGFTYELMNAPQKAIHHYQAALDLASLESHDYDYADTGLKRLKSLPQI